MPRRHATFIRPARPRDAAALARLRFEFRSSLGRATEPRARFLARCRRWMAARLRGRVWRAWVAVDADTIVGALWLAYIEKIPNPIDERERHAYLTNVYVRPALRGRRLGARLIDAALRDARANAVDAVILWPTMRSRPLYRRHGAHDADDMLEFRTARGVSRASRTTRP